MLDKLHKLLFTTLLLIIVGIVLWWTLFLRDQFSDHQGALREREDEIQQLEESLKDVQAERTELNSSLVKTQGNLKQAQLDLVAKDKLIATKEAAIVELGRDLEKVRQELELSEAEVRALDSAIRLLKVDRRLARVEILKREETPEGPRTQFSFSEVGADGKPVGAPQILTVAGTRIYFEALVIKFDDTYVEAGDFLRGASVCLFQRVFGDRQAPEHGIALETRGKRPQAYSSDSKPDPFYDELWDHFWAYAEDPEAARAKGVRALHGEAPFIEASPGRSYRIVLRASGWLTITPE